jgi:MscS family membrane protein
MLTHHPKVESATVYVRLTAIRDSSFELEVFAYVLATVWQTFLEIQEDLLLRIIETVEASGAALAFPSQTSYNASDAGLDATKSQAAMETVRRWREHGELPFPDYITEDASGSHSETKQGSSKEALHVRTGSNQTTQ